MVEGGLLPESLEAVASVPIGGEFFVGGSQRTLEVQAVGIPCTFASDIDDQLLVKSDHVALGGIHADESEFWRLFVELGRKLRANGRCSGFLGHGNGSDLGDGSCGLRRYHGRGYRCGCSRRGSGWLIGVFNDRYKGNGFFFFFFCCFLRGLFPHLLGNPPSSTAEKGDDGEPRKSSACAGFWCSCAVVLWAIGLG